MEKTRAANFIKRYRICSVSFALLFALCLVLVVAGKTQSFDESALVFFSSIRSDALTSFFRGVTFCGNPWTVVFMCIFIIALPERMKIGVPVSLLVAAGALSHTIIKEVVSRLRPDAAGWLIELDDTSYSFPSGHSNIGMIFWVALLFLVSRMLIQNDFLLAAVLLRAAFAVFAVLIGLSRPYLGVHYPSDILGGWLLAWMFLFGFFAFYDSVWPAKWRITGSLYAHHEAAAQ